MKLIWSSVLQWIQVQHTPKNWDEELNWCIKMGKGKGWRVALFKLAAAETIYGVWLFHNSVCFGKTMDRVSVTQDIISKIVFRGWYIPCLKPHIVSLMLN